MLPKSKSRSLFSAAVRFSAGLMIPCTAIILLTGAFTSAHATINSISSDWCQSCLPGAVHRIVAGKQTSMLVKGQYVDLSTRVEISGSGVSVSFGQRTGGSNSSVVVLFNVSSSAALGDRTVKLRYAIETSGPDTFTVKVVRGGTVDSIERVFTNRHIPPTAIPVNQRVRLVFSGTRIGNAAVAQNLALKNPQILSGSTENRCEIEVEFTRVGNVDINLVDADVGPQPAGSLFRFFYGGAKSVTVVGEVTASAPTTIPLPHIAVGGTSTPATFVDVAPRANMLNLFRRTGNSITVNGQTFLQVEDRWCSENNLQRPPTGSAAKLITLPNIVWGVSNFGTAEVTAGFVSELSANNQVVQTQNIPASTLHPGATRDFTFQRTRSTVRVVRFAAPNQPGCFVRPSDPDFFEDPQFTVRVDVGNAVPESQANRANNIRNY